MTAVDEDDVQVRVGELELGNAPPLEATIQMISAQRHFDTAMQAIQTYRRLDEKRHRSRARFANRITQDDKENTMLRSLYTAATGMEAQETKMDVIAHNLANTNTTGFKKSRVEFEDLLSDTIRSAAPASPAGRRQPAARCRSAWACAPSAPPAAWARAT